MWARITFALVGLAVLVLGLALNAGFDGEESENQPTPTVTATSTVVLTVTPPAVLDEHANCRQWLREVSAADELEIVSQSGQVFEIVNHTKGLRFRAVDVTTSEDLQALGVGLMYIGEEPSFAPVTSLPLPIKGTGGFFACDERTGEKILLIEVDTPLPEMTPLPPREPGMVLFRSDWFKILPITLSHWARIPAAELPSGTDATSYPKPSGAIASSRSTPLIILLFKNPKFATS